MEDAEPEKSSEPKSAQEGNLGMATRSEPTAHPRAPALHDVLSHLRSRFRVGKWFFDSLWDFRILASQNAIIGERENPILEVSVNGARLALDLRELHDFLMYRDFSERSFYEGGTTSLILEGLEPGMTFFDVGANNGYFSLAAWSRLRDGGGAVQAFEPNPSSFARLAANVALNSAAPHVICNQVGLSDHNGTARLFYHPSHDDGLGSLVRESEESIPIVVRRFDDLFPSPPRCIVKIDVEGSELAVLKGMRELFRQNQAQALIVEWNVYSTSEMWDFLSERFRIFRIMESSVRGPLNPISEHRELEWVDLCNLWCVPT